MYETNPTRKKKRLGLLETEDARRCASWWTHQQREMRPRRTRSTTRTTETPPRRTRDVRCRRGACLYRVAYCFPSFAVAVAGAVQRPCGDRDIANRLILHLCAPHIYIVSLWGRRASPPAPPTSVCDVAGPVSPSPDESWRGDGWRWGPRPPPDTYTRTYKAPAQTRGARKEHPREHRRALPPVASPYTLSLCLASRRQSSLTSSPASRVALAHVVRRPLEIGAHKNHPHVVSPLRHTLRHHTHATLRRHSVHPRVDTEGRAHTHRAQVAHGPPRAHQSR